MLRVHNDTARIPTNSVYAKQNNLSENDDHLECALPCRFVFGVAAFVKHVQEFDCGSAERFNLPYTANQLTGVMLAV